MMGGIFLFIQTTPNLGDCYQISDILEKTVVSVCLPDGTAGRCFFFPLTVTPLVTRAFCKPMCDATLNSSSLAKEFLHFINITNTHTQVNTNIHWLLVGIPFGIKVHGTAAWKLNETTSSWLLPDTESICTFTSHPPFTFSLHPSKMLLRWGPCSWETAARAVGLLPEGKNSFSSSDILFDCTHRLCMLKNCLLIIFFNLTVNI